MDPRLLRRYRFVVHDSKAPPLYKRESARVVRHFEAYGPKLFERLYWEEAGRKVPSGLDKKLVAARVFFGTPDSWFENRTSEAFYDASAFQFLKYAGRACALTLPAENSLESPIYRFVIDSLMLLQDHNSFCGKMDTDYGYHAGAFVQHYHLFQQSRNAVEGRRVSDTELGAATIRLAIEARLKRAVGIFWTYSPTTQKRTPLKMSILFNAFRERSADIEAATDLEVVKLIYDWSNNYIHAGMRSPTWLNFFAHDLLDPALCTAILRQRPFIRFWLGHGAADAFGSS